MHKRNCLRIGIGPMSMQTVFVYPEGFDYRVREDSACCCYSSLWDGTAESISLGPLCHSHVARLMQKDGRSPTWSDKKYPICGFDWERGVE